MSVIGRPVQVILVKPSLVLDLLRNACRDRNELEGAKVLDFAKDDGQIILVVEKDGWNPVEADGMPYVRHLVLNEPATQ